MTIAINKIQNKFYGLGGGTQHLRDYGDEIGSTWNSKSIFLLRCNSTVIELKKINANKNAKESIANNVANKASGIANKVIKVANRVKSFRFNNLCLARA